MCWINSLLLLHCSSYHLHYKPLQKTSYRIPLWTPCAHTKFQFGHPVHKSNPNFTLMETTLTLGRVPHIIFITSLYIKQQDNCAEYPYGHPVLTQNFSLDTRYIISNPNFTLMESTLAHGTVPHHLHYIPLQKTLGELWWISIWTPCTCSKFQFGHPVLLNL